MTSSIVEYEYIELSETEKKQMHFMANRLGFDHFLIAGYDSVEFRKHVLSQGRYETGAPKIALNTTLAGAAYIIARILTDFEFSDELRRAVHSIINTVLTGREMRENSEKRST
jgi:hypothetical protein